MEEITIQIPQKLANAYALADRERFPASQLAEGLERESTIFYGDFTAAEPFGIQAVKETFANAHFRTRGYKVVTELAVVVNHKGWEWYSKMEAAQAAGLTQEAKRCEQISQYYFERYHEVYDWAAENLHEDEATFFYSVLD